MDGNEYMAENRALQMKMSQERVMKLLEGTNIYKDRYVGIREMIQNAIDASLLQLWSDLIQNRYSSCGLSREKVLEGFELFDLLDRDKAAVFGNYDITVEVIEDKLREQVIVVVKDKGIGINTKDVEYIADIGSSKEKNDRIRKLTEGMPVWLRPSGVFGIGLQSVFQLTDCIEFYTRQHNQPERQISIYSYGKNQGKIETKIVSECGSELYYDNAIPGTNTKIVIEPRKFFGGDVKKNKSSFLYYDPEFDTGEELHMIFEEISRVCENKIREAEYDYFNIYYDVITIERDGRKTVPGNSGTAFKSKRCLRRSYMFQEKSEGIKKGKFWSLGMMHKQVLHIPQDSGYIFESERAFFWDKRTSRYYKLTLRPCTEGRDGKESVSLPQKVRSLYEISYKFNKISNTEAIYAQQDPSGHLHAGFLKLEVLILDDKPMNYMNIDRDRLREGAIDEEELLAVREEIVKRWCRYLCEEDENGGKSIEWRYRHRRHILISLILTFYRNVSADVFSRFIGHCGKLAPLWDICLEGEEMRVSELWSGDRIFQADIAFPESYWEENIFSGEMTGRDILQREESEEAPEEAPLRVAAMENIYRLPHRMINIEAICRAGNRLQYFLRLRNCDGGRNYVKMDEGACLYDYYSAIDWSSEKEKALDTVSLKGKVFKPDSRFRKLAVPCFPHTFRKGRNMGQELDYCIKWYILSPFDELSAGILERNLDEGEAKLTRELSEAVMQGRQLKKCAAYIMKHSEEYDGSVVAEKDIEEEYERFLSYFYELLAKNWEKFPRGSKLPK